MRSTSPAVQAFLVVSMLLFASRCCVAHQRQQRSRRSLRCFECSWLAEQVLQDEYKKEFAQRWNKEYGRLNHAIDNPFKPPLLDSETFSEPPSKGQLESHCGDCTTSDACARWTFYGNTGKAVNVTWMCVRSLETGCFVENMANQFVKEVCLCTDRHHCNAASEVAVLSLAVVLLWATSPTFAWTAVS